MKAPAVATPLLWPARYGLLDGIRGIAALVVVLNHLDAVSSAAGHAAVMVFFVISGYCITASADSFRRNARGFREFMLRRLKRIYPPYLLALLFFVGTRLLKTAMGAPNSLHHTGIEWIQNLTLTQWLSDLFHPVAEPVQNATLFVVAFWSLNYEEQFYLVMAVAVVLAARWRLSLLAPVVFLGILGLAWNWIIPGAWVCGFFIEYWAHFALGACLFFALTQFDDPRHRSAFLWLTGLIGIASAIRIEVQQAGDAGYHLRAMTELCFLSIVTLVLYYVRPFSARICNSPLWRPVAALGTISYSLYLIHQFNLTFVSVIAQHLVPTRSPHSLFVVTEVLLFLVLAMLFWWLCERPFIRTKPPTAGRVTAVVADPRPA